MANASLYGSGETSDDMARTALSEREKQTENKPKADPQVRRYWREMERYRRAAGDWMEEGDGITKTYLDEGGNSRSRRRFALLWANIETLKPAVYAQAPTVMCTRRYKDRDPTARAACEMLERATNTMLELYGADETFRMVRDDRLLPGRGAAWVRYEAEFDQHEYGEDEEAETYDVLRSEKVCVDYVYWKDFGHNQARTWSEVWLVWRCVYKTQDEVEDRFGPEVAARLTYDTKAPSAGMDTAKESESGDDYVRIYEVWDKRRRTVSWMTDGEDQFLESGQPPINVHGFFPCPEPCYATKTSKGLIPKPDYCYYRDQAKEINDLTDKIGALTEWLIVKGFIPGGPSTISDPIQEAVRDKSNRELFVEVESMTEWVERGGAAKLIDWLPVDKVVIALKSAIDARAQLIQDVFQITGISDILRGETDPKETLGAQQLKAQTGSRRLRNTKDEIARFCRDIGRLVAEVISEKFEPQSIADISGFRYAPVQPMPAGVVAMPGVTPQMQPQQPEQDEDPQLTFDDRVIQLLRDDRMRSFRIDVETDSTIQPDQAAEQKARIEFITAAGGFIKQAVETVSQAPALAHTAGEMLMFAARGFHVGRTLEETMERDFAAMAKQLRESAGQQQEDPAVAVAKMRAQVDMQKAQLDAKMGMAEMQQTAQIEAAKMRQQTAADAAAQQQDAALRIREQNVNATLKAREQNLNAAAKARDAQARAQEGQARLRQAMEKQRSGRAA